MPAVTPPTMTPLGPVPSTSDPANFDAEADGFLGQLPTFESELAAVASNVYNNALFAESEATDAETSAAAAMVSETAANQSAIDAAAAAGAAPWSALTSYSPPTTVYSPLDLKSYRCILAIAGNISNPDPSLDPAHWGPVIPAAVGSILYMANNFGAFGS